MGEKAARKTPSYGTEEIQRALVFVAAANGNANQAARALEDDGLKIAPETLRRWVNRHQEDYERIRAEQLPKIRERAAERHHEQADREMALARKMTERLEKKVDEIPARDLPGGLRNVETSVGINRDKAEKLTDQASVVVKHKSADEILKSLASQLGVKRDWIDSTATEEPIEPLPVAAGD